jgi:hypothetical protein
VGLRWEEGLPSLGDDWRGLEPIAWSGGFAALESVFGEVSAVWVSTDGFRWASQELPGTPSENVSLVAFRDGLVLSDILGDYRHPTFRLRHSTDGRNWKLLGQVGIDPETPGYVGGGNLTAIGDRLALIAYIGPDTCCGALPAHDSTGSGWPNSGHAAAAPGTDELGMWAWTTDDAITWTKERMRGLGNDGLSVMTPAARGFVGIREHVPENWLVQSADGIEWHRIGTLPPDVNLYSAVQLQATDDGYVLAADTAESRGAVRGAGPHLTIWRVSLDGTFTEVFDRTGWQLLGLAARGSTVLMTGHDYSPFVQGQHALALVSRDAGASFELSAGWPAMTAGRCLGGVAFHGRTVIASAACGVRSAPEILVGDLP